MFRSIYHLISQDFLEVSNIKELVNLLSVSLVKMKTKNQKPKTKNHGFVTWKYDSLLLGRPMLKFEGAFVPGIRDETPRAKFCVSMFTCGVLFRSILKASSSIVFKALKKHKQHHC